MLDINRDHTDHPDHDRHGHGHQGQDQHAPKHHKVPTTAPELPGPAPKPEAEPAPATAGSPAPTPAPAKPAAEAKPATAAATPAASSPAKKPRSFLALAWYAFSIVAIIAGIAINNLELFAPQFATPGPINSGMTVGTEKANGSFRLQYEITDQKGVPVQGADVQIHKHTAYTNAIGIANFPDVPKGEVDVRIHARDHKRVTDWVTVGPGAPTRTVALHPIYSREDVIGIMLVIAGTSALIVLAILKLRHDRTAAQIYHPSMAASAPLDPKPVAHLPVADAPEEPPKPKP
jgi:hypothetical protein